MVISNKYITHVYNKKKQVGQKNIPGNVMLETRLVLREMRLRTDLVYIGIQGWVPLE